MWRFLFVGDAHDWTKYRLADAVKGSEAQRAWRGWEAVRRKYRAMYPGSIATSYLEKTKDRPRANDLEILCDQVVSDRANDTDDAPRADSAVVHLRLGDVVDGDTDYGLRVWKHGSELSGSGHQVRPTTLQLRRKKKQYESRGATAYVGSPLPPS